MSSNAFARSRPRVRHQRLPRQHSCDHPRFLQLVNEIARINESKKKQQQIEGRDDVSSTARNDFSDDDPSTTDSYNTNVASNNQLAPSAAFCSNHACGSQTLNGYGSPEANQSTSALHANLRQDQNVFDRQQLNLSLHQHNLHLQIQQHHLTHQHRHQSNHLTNIHHQESHHQQHQQAPQQQSNILLHQDDRCPVKNTSNNFGYSKQNLVDQNSSNFNPGNSNNTDNIESIVSAGLNHGNLTDNNNDEIDLRQDENRSKRKRSANDSSANTSRKNSCGSSKRLKSSPDVRPLSPSFTKCPICLLDSMDRDPSFTNTCFHLFCYVCIENWTKNKATCPLCRTKFTKIIYNIKSATSYEEKIASPIRRDDDDGYLADRIMLEHLSGINSNSTIPTRNANGDDMQFLFENLRNQPDALMPQYFVNQMDPRQGGTLHSFNTVTSTPNFNSNVPHPPFAPANYNPIASNYIALFPPNRIATTTSTAITSAYTANNNLTNINSDPSGRRISRSGRYIYSRNYEPQTVESPSRVSRSSNPNVHQPNLPSERHQHGHHQNSHQHHHLQQQSQQQQPHQQQQHQARLTTLELNPRQNQRLDQSHAHIPLTYHVQQRHYNANAYPRRAYDNTHVEHQHLLDTLYRQMPDL